MIKQIKINGVVRSLFISYICKRKFFTTRYLRSKAPAWCESSGQAALFNSLPDEQINTAKLISSKVPHEPFSGGSCTPDGGERPTSFLKSQNLFNSRNGKFKSSIKRFKNN